MATTYPDSLDCHRRSFEISLDLKKNQALLIKDILASFEGIVYGRRLLSRTLPQEGQTPLLIWVNSVSLNFLVSELIEQLLSNARGNRVLVISAYSLIAAGVTSHVRFYFTREFFAERGFLLFISSNDRDRHACSFLPKG